MEWIDAVLTAVKLSGFELGLLLLIVLLAAVLRGYAGFGFSAAVVACASLFIPTREAVPMVLALEIIASIQMARRVWKDVDWRLVAYILLGVALFSPLGQWVLSVAEVNWMRLITAMLLLVSIAAVAAGRFFTMGNTPPTWSLVGLVSGFMNGLLAMGGMWTIVLLINTGIKIAVLRACLVALFFITDFYGLGVAAAVYDLVDATLLWRVICVLPALLLGIKIGANKFNPAREGRYKKIVLTVLAVLALLLIVRTAVAMG